MSQPDLQTAGTGADGRSWRTVDIVVTAVLAVAFGVVFWAWNTLWVATSPAFTAFPPAQAFMYGIWLVPGVLAMLVVRKPGAAFFAMLLAATVSALLGSQWGTQVIWYGALEGLAPELIFLAFGYRRFTLPVAVTAAAAAGLTAFGLDWYFYYLHWSPGWLTAFAVILTASSMLIAGLGSWLLVRRMAATGVLDALPSGRDRERI
ncbi:MAG TPA: ECF transporter S component [Jiangellaceae bacterium]|jgi:energy-coupling factor transport system substrate-specific component|nr:ECF transporter S component [Jiangellaceae bacterium]